MLFSKEKNAKMEEIRNYISVSALPNLIRLHRTFKMQNVITWFL